VEQYKRLFGRMREAVPNLTLRTTFLVGFPGETDAHFENLLRFVQEMQFDRVGVFTYSAEEGTPSFEYADAVPPKVMRERKNRLMAVQQLLSLANNQKWVGREMDVLLESRRDGVAVGRSPRDAPEIDGTVRLPGCALLLGSVVRARILSAAPYDLTAASL